MWRRIAAEFVGVLAVLGLMAGCGSGLNHGTVYNKTFRPTYTVLMPISTSCGQNCSTVIMVPITYPDAWTLFVRECQGAAKKQRCQTGEVDVDHATYDRLHEGDYYDGRKK